MGAAELTAPAEYAPARRLAAWGVHLLTASSAPAGVLAVLAIFRDDAATAFWWMAYTIAVDSIDGTLARRVNVKAVVPGVDGARLDDIVDYFTWVVVPAIFALRMPLLPPGWAVAVASAMMLASAYGFAQKAAKTADHYFTGFPSYWNIVVFYLYALAWPPAVNALVLSVLAVMVFVPIRYLYPSRTSRFAFLTNALGVAWGVALLWFLAVPDAPRGILVASLAFPAYYVAVSFWLHFRGLERA